jgi:UDP-N-acetylmuramoyl-L-alanyl-D-glutamate--2,6-diaminopimelate ligase
MQPALAVRQLLPEAPWKMGVGAAPVCGLAYHAGRVQPGFLYAAWRGRRADGHAFVPQALANGATALLLERPVADLPDDISVAVVPDVRASLGRAAQVFYGDPTAQMRTLCITGTNGKTTCAALLQSVLQAAGQRTGRIGTLGSQFEQLVLPPGLTTPESVDLLAQLAQMRQAGADALVLEASSQALAQQRLSGIRCDVALFLNLSPEHLDWHGSMAAYAAAKASLLERLKPTGVVVTNLDDPFGRSMYEAAKAQLPAAQVLGFSRQVPPHPAAEVCLLQALEPTSDQALNPASEGVPDPVPEQGVGCCLRLRLPSGEHQLKSALYGAFNHENLLACVGVGVALQLPWEAVSHGIAGMQGIPGRMQQVSMPQQPLVVVDFAHTPAAVQDALCALRPRVRGRLLCVLGCGGDRDASKRGPMGAAATRGADYVFITSDNPRREDPAAIAAAVVVGVEDAGGRRSPSMCRSGFRVELARERAIEAAVQACGVNDAVLIAGRGHETGQIVGDRRLPFDDAEVARAALGRWRGGRGADDA